ncbi:MAG: hypothetical protein B7C24_17435 [Bacteroidetes bacterium 4572_77]|nr:MAG: hypothetical protein B7C24_17435 [Bacteroidetes bacterium 4572_77]
MAQYGFWPQAPITVNTKNNIVDGQQRWSAALELGISEIPATILNFPSIEAEASYYADVNSYNTRQTLVNMWNAKYIGNHPIAIILYNLESNPFSLLRDRIVLKGKNAPATKFTSQNVLQIISATLIGVIQHYKQSDDARWTEIITRFAFEEIQARCNLFVSWFDKAFGNDKKLNPVPYSTAGLYAITKFYVTAKEAGHFKNGDTAIANKLRKYVFTNEFNQMSHIGRFESLIRHYNKGRKVNKLKYRDDLNN